MELELELFCCSLALYIGATVVVVVVSSQKHLCLEYFCPRYGVCVVRHGVCLKLRDLVQV